MFLEKTIKKIFLMSETCQTRLKPHLDRNYFSREEGLILHHLLCLVVLILARKHCEGNFLPPK